ncbi:MAG: TolC family protein [Syntrophales bacterium]|jgi:outer membrane protein TolC
MKRRWTWGGIKWQLILIIASVAWASVLWAADPVPVMTLKESIDLALKRSVLIQSAQEGVTASRAQKDQAFTNFLPKLSTTYNYTYVSPKPVQEIPNFAPFPSELAVGTQDNYTWALEARQPLFAGGSILANYKANQYGIDIARLDQQTSVLDTIRDVKVSYFTVLNAEKIVDVSKQAVQQLEAHRDMAQNFFDVGLIPRNDLLKSEVELAHGKQSLVQADNGMELARSKFNTVLRQAVDTPVKLEDILTYKPFELSMESCQKSALDNRPEMRLYNMRLEQSREMVKIARSEYYPSINAVGHYERYGDNSGLNGSIYKGQENWYLMAVASWNFWEWGKIHNKVDESRSRENQASLAIENIKDQITLQVRNAWLQLREAEKRIVVTQKAIEQAEENFRIVTEQYKEQVATSTDVLDAQTLLTRAKSDYENALGDFSIAHAQLERAMGLEGR